MMKISNKDGFLALLPLLVFVCVFLGVGIGMNDFYLFPAPCAVVLGVLIAFILSRSSFNEKLQVFLAGCGDSRIITMCLIYLLAGAFAAVSKAMGSVDTIVQFGLDFIPLNYLAIGVFLIASFLSLASGTSVGAIVALGPICAGFAAQGTVSISLLSGALLSGAMFGDNLSVISDTTIASTQTMGTNMKDKLMTNIHIAVPAFLLAILCYVVLGTGIELPSERVERTYDLLRALPYVAVLLMAFCGVNVFITLLSGLALAATLGLYYGSFGLIEVGSISYSGFLSMADIFFLSLLTGGLSYMMDKAGGVLFLLQKIEASIHSKRTAELGVVALISTINAAVANNTVAIVVAGPIVKKISESYKLSTKKTASIMDIFACVVQGLLPYGAQVLLVIGFSDGKLGYTSLLQNLWYIYALAFFALLSIFFPRLFFRKKEYH